MILSEAQKVAFKNLLEEISEYSEESYCAGWLDGVEFTMLRWVLEVRDGVYDEQKRFGLEWRPSREKLALLVSLSDSAGGVWPVWQDSGSDWYGDGGAGPVPLPFGEAIEAMRAYDKKWRDLGFKPGDL